MKLSGIQKLLAIVAIASFSACSSDFASNGVEEAGHEEHEEGNSEMVSITPDQAETIGLELGPIKKMPMNNTVKVNGILELFPQDRAEVSPLIGGNVKEIYIIEGDDVVKGQLLARMEHPVFIEMQQEFQMKYSSLDYLKLEYERQENLYNEKVGSAKDYQSARSEYLSTKAAVNGLKFKLEMLGLNADKIAEGKMFTTIPITSPIDGYVHLVNVNLGEFAGPMMGRKQVMFEITNNARLHVDLRIYEKDIYSVKEGQRVYFTVANRPGLTLEAVVHSVGKAFEDAPKSVHVHAHIQNIEGELLPGMYVEGRIAVSDDVVLAVPEEAIVTEGESAFIFMQIEEQEEHGHEESTTEKGEGAHGHEKNVEKLNFRKVIVVTGIHDAGYVEIKLLDPLPDDSQIVLAGAYTLSSEMIKGELEHDH